MNQLALAAQAARAGATVTLGGIVADDVAALRAATAALVADHDMVLLSGGSSIGARDLTAGVLEAIGARVVFHGIDVRPGKPTIFARLGDRPILGMPGVPASAMIIFDLFVAPLVRRLGGERVDPDRAWPARGRARLTRRVPSVVGREDVVRVRLRPAPDAPDAWLAEPLLGGNAAVATLVRADGLVIVPAASDALAEGADVDVLLYA
jgi:molybdopterin molybdotransferase